MNISYKNRPCSRRRMVKMLNWFKKKGKQVEIVYQYNNSIGWEEERKYVGIIKDFTVKSDRTEYEEFIEVKITLVDGTLIEEWFDNFWEFTGLGRMQFCNSGPYCHFTVRFIDEKGV